MAPKGAPKPAAKTGPSAPAPAPAAAPAAKSAPAKAAPAAADDDPFGVDEAANSRAIPLSPRPAKGKTVRLLCPMCETPGFTSADSAGKEVKCSNEKCALPIFTAPKASSSAPSADPRTPSAGAPVATTVPPAKKASPAVLMSAVGMLLMSCGAVWFFVFNQPGAIKPPPAAPQQAGDQTPVAMNPETAVDKPGAKKADDPKKPRGEELRASVLSVLVDLSRVTEKNRSKHFCRRLTAEAFVEAGDLKAARENIDQLLNLTPKLPFHQVSPLTQIAWRALADGKADDAKAALDSALKSAAELPAVGRLTFDVTTDLAAALFVSGRAADAQSVLKRENMLPSGSRGTLSALSRFVHLNRSFDWDESAAMLPIVAWKSPAWVVATLTMVLHGHADKVDDWMKLCPDAETRAECWAAWGDSVVVAGNSATVAQDASIAAAVKDESPATQAQVWARVAAGRLARQQKESGQKALTKAVDTLNSIPLPNNFVVPDMKELMKFDLTDAIAPRLNAIAAAEVARAQTLFGQSEPAAESLAAALQHLRGHAPSPVLASRLFEATSKDSNNVKAQLKTALNLKTDDKVVQALTTYRAKCRLLFDAANARFALQTEFLKAAVDWPLLDAVFTAAVTRAGDNTPAEDREEFLKTNLAVRLGQRLRVAGENDQARQCENAVTTGELIDARDVLERETAAVITVFLTKGTGNINAVSQKLSAYQATKAEGEKVSTEDTDWSLLWGLRLANRLVKGKKTESAFELVTGFKDMLWREEGFESLAALVSKDPVAAEPVWKKYRPSLLTPTEKMSLFRGLCAGLTTSLPAKP